VAKGHPAMASKEEFIEAIYLFGSRLRGTFHEGSDLDLAILLSLKPSPDPERPY
jgi:predicted nucleotidyltransferase